LDPEYELAIKISEYFEFVWDGRVPAWSSLDGETRVTFSALTPLKLGERTVEPGLSLIGPAPPGDTFRGALVAGNEPLIRAKSLSF
jgi:hypothetical protein